MGIKQTAVVKQTVVMKQLCNKERTFNELYELYLDFVDGVKDNKNVDPNLDTHNMICKECKVEKVLIECFKTCPNCGAMDIDDPAYQDAPWAPHVALYKRRLYCQEKLKLYTGHKQCRSANYTRVVRDLKDYDIKNILELKQHLKDWKQKRLYKYVYNIFFDITGKRLIKLTGQNIDFLSRKFVEVETKFKEERDLHKRKNFFNYNSCIFLLMKKYKFKGYTNIVLPLNHLRIAKILRRLL